MSDERQAILDHFYHQNGPCCAGCDWWRHISASVGECTKSPPVAGHERLAMLGMQGVSFKTGAGHVVTKREHHCGGFTDTFEWRSLPLPYRRSVGAA